MIKTKNVKKKKFQLQLFLSKLDNVRSKLISHIMIIVEKSRSESI